VTLLAARNGVPTLDVVRAGRTADNDAIIVMRARGAPLAGADDPPGAETVEAVWDSVLALAAAGLAHGDLHPGAFRAEDGRVLIDDMSRASVATDEDQRYVDLAQLLALSALFVGPDDALAIAGRRLDGDELAAIVPYVQKAALGPRLRDACAKSHLN